MKGGGDVSRDLRADLEICNRATPGPWINDGTGEISYQDTIVSLRQIVDYVPYDRDVDFIAAAREGWPEAIERAIKAEAEVERLQKSYAITNESWQNLQSENALLRKVADIAWNVVETRGMSDVLLSELAGRLADWETWKEGEK